MGGRESLVCLRSSVSSLTMVPLVSRTELSWGLQNLKFHEAWNKTQAESALFA